MSRARSSQNDVLRQIITQTEPFTLKDVCARLVGVPVGTVSGYVARMHKAHALRVTRPRSYNQPAQYISTSRMPKTVDGAREMTNRVNREYGAAKKKKKRKTRSPKPARVGRSTPILPGRSVVSVSINGEPVSLPNDTLIGEPVSLPNDTLIKVIEGWRAKADAYDQIKVKADAYDQLVKYFNVTEEEMAAQVTPPPVA